LDIRDSAIPSVIQNVARFSEVVFSCMVLLPISGDALGVFLFYGVEYIAATGSVSLCMPMKD